MPECKTCGANDREIQTHHIVPRSRGGTEHPGNVINVCLDCHTLIHDKRITGSQLIKDGLAAARQRGVTLGRVRVLTDEAFCQVIAMHRDGATCRDIAKVIGVSASTVSRVLRRA